MSMDQQLNRRRIYFSDAEGVGPEEGRGGGVRAVWAAVAFRHSVSDTKDPPLCESPSLSLSSAQDSTNTLTDVTSSSCQSVSC